MIFLDNVPIPKYTNPGMKPPFRTHFITRIPPVLTVKPSGIGPFDDAAARIVGTVAGMEPRRRRFVGVHSS